MKSMDRIECTKKRNSFLKMNWNHIFERGSRFSPMTGMQFRGSALNFLSSRSSRILWRLGKAVRGGPKEHFVRALAHENFSPWRGNNSSVSHFSSRGNASWKRYSRGSGSGSDGGFRGGGFSGGGGSFLANRRRTFYSPAGFGENKPLADTSHAGRASHISRAIAHLKWGGIWGSRAVWAMLQRGRP